MARRRVSRAQRIKDHLDGKSIVFLGMMGSGKSAIGKMVAGKLNLEFKDADAEIEAAAGRSVAEIFTEYGEEEFRRLECRVIERVLSEHQVLLALGGGAFMAEDTRKIIAEQALSVWLKADIEIILERVGRRPTKRPLLMQGDPRQIIQKLMTERDPVYARADLHVTSKGGSKADMRNLVLTELENHLESNS